LQANLNGQTSLRVDSTWATQERLLKAIASLNVPDRVIRAETLSTELNLLAESVGLTAPPNVEVEPTKSVFGLSDVVTPEIEKAAEAAYRRDYMVFGFGAFTPHAA